MLKPRYTRTVVLRVDSHNPLTTRKLRSFILDSLASAVKHTSIESEYRDVLFGVQDMSDPAKRPWS